MIFFFFLSRNFLCWRFVGWMFRFSVEGNERKIEGKTKKKWIRTLCWSTINLIVGSILTTNSDENVPIVGWIALPWATFFLICSSFFTLPRNKSLRQTFNQFDEWDAVFVCSVVEMEDAYFFSRVDFQVFLDSSFIIAYHHHRVPFRSSCNLVFCPENQKRNLNKNCNFSSFFLFFVLQGEIVHRGHKHSSGVRWLGFLSNWW